MTNCFKYFTAMSFMGIVTYYMYDRQVRVLGIKNTVYTVQQKMLPRDNFVPVGLTSQAFRNLNSMFHRIISGTTLSWIFVKVEVEQNGIFE